MKNHKRVETSVNTYDITSIDAIVEVLQDFNKKHVETEVYIGWHEIVLKGWRPMTEKELATQKRAAQKRKETYERKKAEKFEKDLKNVQDWIKKYGVPE